MITPVGSLKKGSVPVGQFKRGCTPVGAIKHGPGHKRVM